MKRVNMTVLMFVLFVIGSASAMAQKYAPVDLSAGFPGNSWAFAISANGTVAGAYYTNQFHSVVMKPAVLSLQTLFDRGDRVTGINDAGVAVGFADDLQGYQRAVRWDADGTPTQLLVGDVATLGGINNTGVIVGTARRRAVVIVGDVPTNLPLPAGYGFSSGYAISDKTSVAGNVSNDGYFTQPALWDKYGNVKVYPNLGGGFGALLGINNRGKGVGWSFVNGNQRAVLANPTSSVLKDLGTLGGFISIAYGINDAGVTVGASDDQFGKRQAFIYKNGRMRQLPRTVGMVQAEAYGINYNGVIVGAQWDANGGIHATMWMPTW